MSVPVVAPPPPSILPGIAPGPDAPAALELRHVKKFFGGLPATQDVSMTIRAGERRLMIGPNGAGKTTLFNQITGDFFPTSGEIRFFGRDITRMRPAHRAQLGISRTYQIITLFSKDSCEHNIVLGLLGVRTSRWNMFAPLAAYAHLRDEARELLDSVGLGRHKDTSVAALAYGEKRRLEIALALSQKPKLLLLDEPLAGLSAGERGDIKRLIAAIPRDTTVVTIEHDMDTALDLADTVTLLHYGKVIVEGERYAVVADPKTREVYLGD